MIWVSRMADDATVDALLRQGNRIYDFVNAEDGYADGSALDFDKEWHAVHFLLTGSAEASKHPLSLILGDYPVYGPDNGYGRAWLVSAERLRVFHDTLSAIGDAAIAAGYDPAGMTQQAVYLGDTIAREGEAALDYLMDHVRALRTFAAAASARSQSAFGLIT